MGEKLFEPSADGCKKALRHGTCLDTALSVIPRGCHVAGLQFCVEQVVAVAHMLAPDVVFTAHAAVGVAAVLEYLSAEVLELAGNAARDNASKTISVRHVFLAIRDDEELNAFFPDTADPSSLRQVLREARSDDERPGKRARHAVAVGEHATMTSSLRARARELNDQVHTVASLRPSRPRAMIGRA